MNCKKLLSLLMTGALAATMMVSSAAAVNIEMENTGAAGAEYSAYRLMDLTTSLKSGHEADAGATGGQNADGHDCWNYNYTVNADFRSVLASVAGVGSDVTDEKAIDAAIKTHVTALEAGDATRAFADAVFAGIQADGIAATKSGVTKTFTDMSQGYYLIVESKLGGGENTPDSYSLVMLDTAGQNDIKVTSKEDMPSLTKKIVVGDAKQDSDLVAVGDIISYELEIAPPKAAIMAEYDAYKYIVHDDISAGLKLAADSVKVSLDGADITAQVNVVTENTGDNCELHVVFDDVKAMLLNADGSAKGDGKIAIAYTCTVQDAAVMGEAGNPNEAYLEFSNNPYASGEGDTDNTPKDKVTAFTFKLIVNKVDEDKNPLEGASFTLMKKDADGEYQNVGPGLMAPEPGGTTFSVSGLDIGEYKLVETTTPDGYQKIDDVEFVIEATAETESDDPDLLTLTVKRGDVDLTEGDNAEFVATLSDGSVATKIVNVTGNRLPSTGGIGVYALYIGGAVLVFGGVGLGLVSSKKRKDDKNA